MIHQASSLALDQRTALAYYLLKKQAAEWIAEPDIHRDCRWMVETNGFPPFYSPSEPFAMFLKFSGLQLCLDRHAFKEERGQVYFIMIKQLQAPASQKSITADILNEHINQSLRDTLALIARFEETGMDIVMKDDYLTLYDIYRRLQEQKQALRSDPEAD